MHFLLDKSVFPDITIYMLHRSVSGAINNI